MRSVNDFPSNVRSCCAEAPPSRAECGVSSATSRYLPLLLAEQLDVVDFVVLTYLRICRPLLYRALSTDRRWLVGSELDNDSAVVTRWRTDEGRKTLGIDANEHPTLLAAVIRLFPLIETAASGPTLSRALRLERRVGSADYVDHYFALSAIDLDTSDAALASAFDTWAAGNPGPAVGRLWAILTDQKDAERAASVLRRAESRSFELTEQRAGALFPVVLELIDALRTDHRTVSAEGDEAVAWLTALLTRASGPPAADLIELVGSDPETIRIFVLAVTRALPRLGTSRSMGGYAVVSPSWLDEVMKGSQLAALNAVERSLLEGDDSSAVGTFSLINRAQQLLGESDMDAWLARKISMGDTTLVDLCSSIRRDRHQSSNARTNNGNLNAASFIGRVGRDEIERQRAELELLNGHANQ